MWGISHSEQNKAYRETLGSGRGREASLQIFFFFFLFFFFFKLLHDPAASVIRQEKDERGVWICEIVMGVSLLLPCYLHDQWSLGMLHCAVFLSPNVLHCPRIMRQRQMPQPPLIPIIIAFSDILFRGTSVLVQNICYPEIVLRTKCLHPCMRLWDKHTARAMTEEKIFTNFGKLRSCKNRHCGEVC